MERIGVIGGSGLYQLEGIEVLEEKTLSTPFGDPSDAFIIARLGEKEIVFLPRHGRKHAVSPSDINYRANIFGMKLLEVSQIISVSAVGSLKEELKPLEFVIPDQFLDRTRRQNQSFFGKGIVAHVSLADPVCPDLARTLHQAALKTGATVHFGGTYVNMEGPQFSTYAESQLYRSWGMDIIGMTNMTEARLAREAEICYCTLAAITDYDCWKEAEESVTVEVVLDNLRKNVSNSKKIVKEALELIKPERPCACRQALQYSLITAPEAVSAEIKQSLRPLIGKYLNK